MRIKFLKNINLLTYKFKIKYDDSHSGATFSFSDLEIVIGTKNYKKSPQQTLQVISHEISEILHVLLNTRYEDGSTTTNYKFFQDHKQFEAHNQILTQNLVKFIK